MIATDQTRRYRHTFFYPANHELGDNDISYTKDKLQVREFRGVQEHKVAGIWPTEATHSLKSMGIQSLRLLIVVRSWLDGNTHPYPPLGPQGLHLDVTLVEDLVIQPRKWIHRSKAHQLIKDFFPGLDIPLEKSIATPGHIYYFSEIVTLPRFLSNLGFEHSEYDFVNLEIDQSMMYTLRGAQSGLSSPVTLTTSDTGRHEVGLFVPHQALTSSQKAYEGIRAVLGEHDEFQPTAISFPTQNFVIELNNATSSISPSFSFHASIITPIKSNPPDPSCHLHVSYTLPSSVFVDPYQLSEKYQDREWVSSPRVYGEVDLELPVDFVNSWGAIVDIIPYENDTQVSLPIHVRYQSPRYKSELDENLQLSLHIPSPQLYYICARDDESLGVQNPFVLYPPIIPLLYGDYVYKDYHYVKNDGPSLLSLRMAPGLIDELKLVQKGTVSAAILGTSYLAYAIFRGWRRNQRRERKGKKRD